MQHDSIEALRILNQISTLKAKKCSKILPAFSNSDFQSISGELLQQAYNQGYKRTTNPEKIAKIVAVQVVF